MTIFDLLEKVFEIEWWKTALILLAVATVMFIVSISAWVLVLRLMVPIVVKALGG